MSLLRRLRAARAERERQRAARTRCAILGALAVLRRLNDEQIADLTGLAQRTVNIELYALGDAGLVVRASGGAPGSFRLPSTSEKRGAVDAREFLAGAR